jgi:hypothetical protein
MELASEVPGNTLNRGDGPAITRRLSCPLRNSIRSEQTMKDVFVGEIHTTRSHPKKSIDDFILIWYIFLKWRKNLCLYLLIKKKRIIQLIYRK